MFLVLYHTQRHAVAASVEVVSLSREKKHFRQTCLGLGHLRHRNPKHAGNRPVELRSWKAEVRRLCSALLVLSQMQSLEVYQGSKGFHHRMYELFGEVLVFPVPGRHRRRRYCRVQPNGWSIGGCWRVSRMILGCC